MNEPRLPWKTAAALAATALLAKWLSARRRSRLPAGRPAQRGSLHDAWHQVRDCRIFSRHGFPRLNSSRLPIVLVHGFGMSGDYYVPLAERLTVERPVHLPDLPGHGRSDKPFPPLSMSGKACALLNWMDSAGVGKAFLAGHSMGAQIAVEAIRRQPQRFAGLVLIGPTRDPHAGLMRHAWRLLKAAPFERFSLFHILLRDYLRMGWRLLPECRAMMHDPLASKLRQLSVPVMLIKGERDAIVPASWLSHLANATRAEQVLVIKGCGHAVHHGAPDEVSAAMRAFLQRAESRAVSKKEGRGSEAELKQAGPAEGRSRPSTIRVRNAR